MFTKNSFSTLNCKVESRAKIIRRVVILALASIFIFASCQLPNENYGNIKGTWKSSYDEIFKISDSSFENYYKDSLSYAGDNLFIKKITDSSGYIFIKYTANSNMDNVVGKWYAIYYSELTEQTVNISGAYKANGKTGTETLAEAISEFTVENGYFAGSSPCERQN